MGDLKRIVAVMGTTIEIRRGIVYVDGKPEASTPNASLTVSRPDMPAMRVPAGTYFVMGDDAGSSEDSRNYGVIPRERILGKVVWPKQSSHDAHARPRQTLADR